MTAALIALSLFADRSTGALIAIATGALLFVSQRLTATDPPMGFAGPESYAEERLPWQSGDLLVLFTDGLSDTLATPEPGSGEAAVLEAVRSEMERGPTAIVEVLFDLAEGATPYIPADDRTAVVLRT